MPKTARTESAQMRRLRVTINGSPWTSRQSQPADILLATVRVEVGQGGLPDARFSLDIGLLARGAENATFEPCPLSEGDIVDLVALPVGAVPERPPVAEFRASDGKLGEAVGLRLWAGERPLFQMGIQTQGLLTAAVGANTGAPTTFFLDAYGSDIDEKGTERFCLWYRSEDAPLRAGAIRIQVVRGIKSDPSRYVAARP